MNRSTLFGLVLCCAVIYFGIVHGISSPMVLFNSHAIILVLGGTAAITLFSYSLDKLSEVWTFVTKGFLFKRKQDDSKLIEEFLYAIKHWYKNDTEYFQQAKLHPYIRDCFHVLNEPNLTVDDVQVILESRKSAVKRKYFEDAKILNNIAKYPPHLGLLGAASGMVQMMLGLGKDGVDMIGSAMAVALTATLWGIFLNNFVFLPLSDSAQKSAEDEMYTRDLIDEAIVLIKANKQEKVVTETVVSRLTVVMRMNVKRKVISANRTYGTEQNTTTSATSASVNRGNNAA